MATAALRAIPDWEQVGSVKRGALLRSSPRCPMLGAPTVAENSGRALATNNNAHITWALIASEYRYFLVARGGFEPPTFGL